jgi:DNA-binding GntR family transcriptional regulator
MGEPSTLIQRIDLANEVYRALRRRIFIGDLQPGAKIRPEQVAKELGVSRTPVTEAINRLAQEELVTLQRNRGTFVSDFSLERVVDMFDVRLMMEQFAADHGIERAPAADLARLQQLLANEEALMREDGVTDYLTWHRINRDFHQQCVALANNVVLSDLYARLNIDIVMARAYQLALLRVPREVHTEHQTILAAYEARDIQALRAALSDHLTRGKNATIDLMKRRAAI